MGRLVALWCDKFNYPDKLKWGGESRRVSRGRTENISSCVESGFCVSSTPQYLFICFVFFPVSTFSGPLCSHLSRPLPLYVILHFPHDLVFVRSILLLDILLRDIGRINHDEKNHEQIDSF